MVVFVFVSGMVIQQKKEDKIKTWQKHRKHLTKRKKKRNV